MLSTDMIQTVSTLKDENVMPSAQPFVPSVPGEEDPAVTEAVNYLNEQNNKPDLTPDRMNFLLKDSYKANKAGNFEDIPELSEEEQQVRRERSEKVRKAVLKAGVEKNFTKKQLGSGSAFGRPFDVCILKHGNVQGAEEYNSKMIDLAHADRAFTPEEQKFFLEGFLAAAERVQKVAGFFQRKPTDQEIADNAEDLTFAISAIQGTDPLFLEGLTNKLQKSQPLSREMRQMKEQIENTFKDLGDVSSGLAYITQSLNLMENPNYAVIDTDSKEFIDFSTHSAANDPVAESLISKGGEYSALRGGFTSDDFYAAAGKRQAAAIQMDIDNIKKLFDRDGSFVSDLRYKTEDGETHELNLFEATNALLNSKSKKIEIFDITYPDKKFILDTAHTVNTQELLFATGEAEPAKPEEPNLWQKFWHWVSPSFYTSLFDVFEKNTCVYTYLSDKHGNYIDEHAPRNDENVDIEDMLKAAARAEKSAEKSAVNDAPGLDRNGRDAALPDDARPDDRAANRSEPTVPTAPKPAEPVSPAPTSAPLSIADRLRKDNETTLGIIDAINFNHPNADKSKDGEFRKMVSDMLEEEIKYLETCAEQKKPLPDNPGRVSKFFRGIAADGMQALRNECVKRDLSTLNSTKQLFKNAAAGRPSRELTDINKLITQEAVKQKTNLGLKP